jgi:hypothetical protein
MVIGSTFHDDAAVWRSRGINRSKFRRRTLVARCWIPGSPDCDTSLTELAKNRAVNNA